MKVIFGIGKVKKIKKAVVSLGVFDGLHIGHLRILKKVIEIAGQIKGKSVVVTFSPHPQSQRELCSLDQRIKFFRKIGIDICIIIKFTKSFSNISASQFIKDFLIRKIHPEYVFVGANFTFGKNAQGNPRLLKKYADIYNFKLKAFPVYKLRARPISSTVIRKLIQEGSLSEAAEFLGRRVSILGVVVKGGSLARHLGFPTANISTHHQVLPPAGVYMAIINLGDEKYNGVCYIGKKPTFKKQRIRNQYPSNRALGDSSLKFESGGIHIETHIFGFNKNIYGKKIEVQFISKIREEKEFASILLLAAQVRKDIRIAQSRFRPLPKI